MNDLETLVIEVAAGVKLMTGILGLTVALLPEDDRAIVLKALAALQAEAEPTEDTARSQLSTRSAAEAGRALTMMVEKFAAEIAASRNQER